MSTTAPPCTTGPGSGLASDVLLRRLSMRAPLSGAERRLVRALDAVPPRQHPVNSELCAAGELRPPRLVVSGWACRQRLLADGRRQIVSFVLPGDLVGSAARPRLPSACAVVALTPVASVDAGTLGYQAGRPVPGRPGIVRALHLIDRMDTARLCDQVVRLGRQTAYERILHLLLELRDRLSEVGLMNTDRYAFPVTQEMLGDAMGLSTVHVNRTLQQIRRERLVEIRGGTVVLLEPRLMEAIAGWQPSPQPSDRW